jgi:hypothetical protein
MLIKNLNKNNIINPMMMILIFKNLMLNLTGARDFYISLLDFLSFYIKLSKSEE